MTDVFTLLDSVRAIVRTGLHYSEDPFDRERYERLLELVAHEYAERTSLDAAEVRARFDGEIGYVTARIGADAAVFDARDRVLLVRRADNGRWGLIAGWVDPNEGPAQTVVRELAEEVGMRARVDRLVGVFHRPATAGENPHGLVSVLYLCSMLGGELRAQPHEVLEFAWRDVDEVGTDEWHQHHDMLARAARDAHWRAAIGL